MSISSTDALQGYQCAIFDSSTVFASFDAALSVRICCPTVWSDSFAAHLCGQIRGDALAFYAQPGADLGEWEWQQIDNAIYDLAMDFFEQARPRVFEMPLHLRLDHLAMDFCEQARGWHFRRCRLPCSRAWQGPRQTCCRSGSGSLAQLRQA